MPTLDEIDLAVYQTGQLDETLTSRLIIDDVWMLHVRHRHLIRIGHAVSPVMADQKGVLLTIEPALFTREREQPSVLVDLQLRLGQKLRLDF